MQQANEGNGERVRTPPPRLSIELVPSSSWYTNVRSEVSKAAWDSLRHACYRNAGHRCEICGGRGPQWPVECHELWEYDDAQGIQRLTGLTALCPECHRVKHFGLARVKGEQEQAGRWLMQVNGWTRREVHEYVQDAFRVWEQRSARAWKVDISWLDHREARPAPAE
ncbi:HNH endonuclease [Deinococcus sp. Arct2-2]|uniref:HNH endonuclease n=1 Tax=Deinococcus sp. Arct2-2 TaxID=2568653 RepID=UPI0010A3FB71|nr:HNH endonuclease [Deinococcus sp. Arct2-2]THF71323.1 HNH endonuclease [Deinococcus sp. Arct2-2]